MLTIKINLSNINASGIAQALRNLANLIEKCNKVPSYPRGDMLTNGNVVGYWEAK